ncbi:MAG: zinc ribbon domain-containing protein [Lachnospiraceae bacterium]|nr:zinc ribbon domain-containing protein [Lachnospiraceae bacterium]
MICPNCGNEIPEGSLFCIRCGAKLESETEKAIKTAETSLKEATDNAKAAKKEAKEASKAEKKAKSELKKSKKQKKEHKGFKVLLALVILLFIFCIVAVAGWFFYLPQASRDFVHMQKDLRNGDYDAMFEHFKISSEDLKDDKEKFAEFAKNEFIFGASIKDILNGNYTLLTNSDVRYSLEYDDASGKFDGDMFTYTVNVYEPLLLYMGRTADTEDGRYVKNTYTGYLMDEFPYSTDVTCGGDGMSGSNDLSVKLILKDGKPSEIGSMEFENDKYDPAEFVELKNGDLYINKMIVDEGYAKKLCEKYAAFTSDLLNDACKGITYEDFCKKYDGFFVPELYADDYDYYYSYSAFYQSYEYGLALNFDKLNDLPILDVNDDSLIVSAHFKGKITNTLEDEDVDDDSYLLVRPYESFDRIIMNSSYEDDIRYLGEKLDEGKTYKEAIDALFNDRYKNGAKEATLGQDVSIAKEAAKYLRDEERDAYFDAIVTFDETEDHLDHPRFTLLDIGSDYPLLVCTDGAGHACSSHLFQYDGNTMWDLGAYGEYGELMIYAKEGVIKVLGGGMGLYTIDYYYVYNGEISHEVELTYEDSTTKAKYTSEGEEINESEFNEIVDKFEDAYPESEMITLRYDDAFDITDDNIKEILY